MPTPEFPRFERPKFKDIEKAAEAYVQARDARMNLTEKECEAKSKLMDAMKKHAEDLPVNADGDHLYRYDELLVVFSAKENVKVRNAIDEVASSDDGEG
jgi:hypothetical protein